MSLIIVIGASNGLARQYGCRGTRVRRIAALFYYDNACTRSPALFNGILDAEVQDVEDVEALAEERDRPPNLERDPSSWVPRGNDWEVRMKQARSALIDGIAKDESWLKQVVPRVLCSVRQSVSFYDSLWCFCEIKNAQDSFNIKAAWLARDGIQDNINIPSASPARFQLEPRLRC